MTTYAWPTADSAFSQFRGLTWRPKTLSDESESPLNGDVQTTSRPGSRWRFTMSFFDQTFAERRRLIAFLERLNGRQNRISFIDPLMPQPAGTIALSGVTVSANAAQFAQSIVLTGCGAGATLLRGDWLKLGTPNFQPVKCVADATANGSGVMTVEFRHMLRAAATAGTSVVTNNCSALYVLEDPDWASHYNGSHADALDLSWIEVFS